MSRSGAIFSFFVGGRARLIDFLGCLPISDFLPVICWQEITYRAVTVKTECLAVHKLLPLTLLRVVEVGVFGCDSIPEGTNRNVHFSGSSNNLPTSLGAYSQARTEHQRNSHKTAGHKTCLNLRKAPPNGTQGTQGNRIKLTKGSPLKQAKHNPTPAPRKDQHRERRTQANEPTRRRPTDTRKRTLHDVQGCQQGSSL